VPTGNPLIQQRLDDLIGEGERQWEEFTAAGRGVIQNPIRLTQWITSCLNLLDKLSVSSNRFVKEFERWVTPSGSRDLNIGAALGVLNPRELSILWVWLWSITSLFQRPCLTEFSTKRSIC
jgi:hypothetical protein